MKKSTIPKGISILSNEEFNKRLSSAKKIRLAVTSQQVRDILSKAGYKFDGKIILNEDDTPLFGVDGRPVTTRSFAALLAGSNIFIPKNVAALFKYFVELKGA